MEQKAFLRLREMIFEFPDGAVIGLGRLEPIEKGWVVRINGATDYEGQDGMFEAIKIASITTQTIAGAKDGEIELWDVVEIFESEEQATIAGRLNGQMSIYQIETGMLKWLD